MDKKERTEKKVKIGEKIKIDNAHLKDAEIDRLCDIIDNPKKYNGLFKTERNSFTDYSSEGKYRREERIKRTLKIDENGMRIEEEFNYQDDDGQKGSAEKVYDTARGVLNLLNRILDL